MRLQLLMLKDKITTMQSELELCRISYRRHQSTSGVPQLLEEYHRQCCAKEASIRQLENNRRTLEIRVSGLNSKKKLKTF